MAPIPEPVPGLVFRYDFLRPREAEGGVEHGKERPACILVRLLAGERLSGVRVLMEGGEFVIGDYVASANDFIILPIQSDPPSKLQLGVVLEVKIDTWPNSGIQDAPGRPGRWSYDRPMPGPKLAEIAKAFRLLPEKRLVTAVVRAM